MNKETIVSVLLLIIGFVFEYLYLGTDQMFFVIKFWLLGVICIVVGTLGLVVYGLIPFLGQQTERHENEQKES